MLKKQDRVLIRTSLMEYRNILFHNYHGLPEEKAQIAKLNKLLQTWKA